MPHKANFRYRRLRRAAVVAALFSAFTAQANNITFHIIDGDFASSSFATALDDPDGVYVGRESFASLTGSEQTLIPAAILAPGVSSGPLFPTGTNTTVGLTFQTNSLGNAPTMPSAGSNFFVTGPLAGGGQAWIGPDLASNSLDIFIDPPDHRRWARGLSLFVATPGGSDVVMRVYNNENALLSQHTFAGDLDNAIQQIGVIASGQPLFRVNLYAPSGFLDVGTLDVYAIPEPSAAFVVGLGFALWAWRRRR